MNTKKFGAVAAALLIGSAVFTAPVANASELVATDPSGVVIAQDQTALLQATPSAPRAVTVTTEPGTLVTIDAKGVKPKRAVANKDGQVTFTKLKAGKEYTVTTADQEAQVTPVINVGKASDLTVMTTDRIDTVDFTWSHKATKARGGSDIGYTLTATPLTDSNGADNDANNGANNDDATAPQPISVEAAGNEGELTGLDPLVMYEFSVTPHNALGNGKASTATMTRTLAQITGLPVPTADQAGNGSPATAGNGSENEQPTPAPAPKPAPAPAPAPKPGPAPAPKPATRTIWVCPDGYGDVNGVCTQTKDYTFHDVTETKPYTYHTEFVNTGWRVDPYPCTSGTAHPDGCWVPLGYDKQVKDSAPAGWTDNGSAYERTVQEKDDTPSGWSDNGSAWIRTTAKVEKVVPA